MTGRNAVENTTRQVQQNPLAAMMQYGMPGSIEASERRGQQQLLASATLPVETGRDGDAAFLALGFTFGDPVDGDALFRHATLPAGWKRVGSDHAMWSYIVDERGLRRVGVFYKAAFYDRRADMHIVDVGRHVANAALYDDDAPTAEGLRLAVLTADELAAFRDGLDRMRVNIAESPKIYGEHAQRLALCDRLAAAHPRLTAERP